MPFTIDPDVHEKSKDGKKLSERTQKDYTGRLNSLAKAGWDTRDALKKNADKVIEHIKEKYPGDDEKAKFKRREILYAIFWAMDEKYLKKTNKFHKYVNTIPPGLNKKADGTETKWLPVKEYKANQD